MIYGSDEFLSDEKGKRWQRCFCTAMQPGKPYTMLVNVFADESDNFMVEPFTDFDARVVGQGKDLMVVMHPKGTVVILGEKPC